MFIVLPMLFLGAMSWTGYAVGNGIQGMLANGSKAASDSASKGTDQIMGAANRSIR
jgi:hypothetical protein